MQRHIHAGDLVQISKPVTAAWIEYMGMSSLERPGPRRTLDQRKSPQRASPCHRRQRQCRHLPNRADGLLRFTVSRHGTLHGPTRRSIRTGERGGCRRPSYRRPCSQCGLPRRTHHRDGDRRRRRQLGAQCRHDRHDRRRSHGHQLRAHYAHPRRCRAEQDRHQLRQALRFRHQRHSGPGRSRHRQRGQAFSTSPPSRASRALSSS